MILMMRNERIFDDELENKKGPSFLFMRDKKRLKINVLPLQPPSSSPTKLLHRSHDGRLKARLLSGRFITSTWSLAITRDTHTIHTVVPTIHFC